MELSSPEIAPLLILSEGEIYFLKIIVPILLLLPWAIAFLFFIIRILYRYLSSLKLKKKETDEQLVPPTRQIDSFQEDRIPKLKEIEEMAITQPRLAIIELSKFIRVVNISSGYERFSLEYFIKDTNKKKFQKWTNILSEKFRASLKEPQNLFAEIILASYQSEEPTTATALSYVQRVRGLKTKSKDKHS